MQLCITAQDNMQNACAGSYLTGWQTTADNIPSAYFDSEKDALWIKKRQGKACPIDTTGLFPARSFNFRVKKKPGVGLSHGLPTADESQDCSKCVQ